MASLKDLLHAPVSWWVRGWVAFAVLNLLLGVFTFRDLDMVIMHQWATAWLRHGLDVYADTHWAVDYPPNGIVMLSPIALLPILPSALAWALLSVVLAMVAPLIAARCIRDDAAPADVVMLTVTFLCWSGTRTVLQFTLLPLVLGLLAWQQAPRRPWLAGVLLGGALMKPQVALPFCIWVLMRRQMKTAVASAVTVAGLGLLYSLRAQAHPLAVASEWLTAVKGVYGGFEPLTGFSELTTLLPLDSRDRWRPLIALVLCGLVALGALPEFLREPRRARLAMVPGLAAAATLLAFRHVSLAFVTLVTASAWLYLDGDAETRRRRRPFFWLLQVAMIVDLPTIERRLSFSGLSLGWVDVVMRHADRLSIATIFVVLIVLARTSARHETDSSSSDLRPAA